ncbi:NCS1 family nucleobase:cation symporter-1 [Scopulibacillus daqui]|uniref:NCS1 family nucleobase:cation symporter-1 n=1 Tax=Scopulibacillus daqui TaxID=1469162 RepID=A0ABS2Q5Z1_9BACL|nr:cytosine permease [Scopulibacillus daqui]MBM7646927.1 NCS1 family nucleobase:cation symporter-1 [Scopulibacillus daqui]
MQIEKRTIDFIPDAERHGSVRNLFFIWFSANAQITTVVTGALSIALGLNIWYAILAIVIGNAIGGFFMASHSAQGPELGIPQMIQSRAQFGVIGAVLPLILVIMMYLGFFSTSTVLGAQALSSAIHLPQTFCIVIVNILAVILVTYGYDFIHKYEKMAGWLFFILFIYITIRLFQQPMPKHLDSPGFSWGPFLLVMSVMVTWQMTFAPYTADYSRYLPKDTPKNQTFWFTYLGSVVGASWMMVLGAFAAVIAPEQSGKMVAYFGRVAGPGLSSVTFVLIVLGVLAINTLNLYGGYMSVMTTVDAFAKFKVTKTARFIFIMMVAVIGTGMSIWGQGNFLNNYSAFLTFLLYFMVPWTAINLIDFYVLRKGNYSVEAIFDLNGEYGKINWTAIGSYALGIVLQFPFMNTEIYEGFVSKWLNGADIAWLIGLVIPGALYYCLMKHQWTAKKNRKSKHSA